MLLTSAAVGAACAVWALEPAELDALATGVSGSTLFSSLERPWRWSAGRPALGARAAQALNERGAALPQIAARHRSSDGAEKLVLLMPERGDAVEAVHMPRSVGRGRVTLCISSQVGCALGCAFCATAALGLGRHLGAGEIVAQVLLVLGELGPRHPGELSRARFDSPSEARIDAFVRALLARRPALGTVRRSRGRDVDAACGQLAGTRRLALAPAG